MLKHVCSIPLVFLENWIKLDIIGLSSGEKDMKILTHDDFKDLKNV